MNAQRQVLLVQQNYGQRFWGAPGGVVDPGETPMQAALREAQEEAGITIEITSVVGLYLLQGGGWPDILAHVFAARIIGGEARVTDPSEIARVEWWELGDLPAPLLPDIDAGLADLQAGRMGTVRTVQRKNVRAPLT